MLREVEIEVPVIAEPKVDPVLALLRNARDKVMAGWVQGCLITSEGVCALGAILLVEGFRSFEHRVPQTTSGWQAVDALNSAMGWPGGAVCDVMRFNDTHSKSQVLAAFDQAIEGRKNA